MDISKEYFHESNMALKKRVTENLKLPLMSPKESILTKYNENVEYLTKLSMLNYEMFL